MKKTLLIPFLLQSLLSYPDWFGYRNGTPVNKKLLTDILSFTENDFKNEEVVSLNKEIITEIF